MSQQVATKDLIQTRILQDRTVLLWGMVNDEMAQNIVECLLYLDSMDSEKEIRLLINSPGGQVTSGFAIYDTLMGMNSPVATYCTGLAASMGSILLSAGQKGRRYVMPHARIMIHQPSGGVGGGVADMKIQMEEVLKTKKLCAEILAENCGQSVEKVLADFDRDYWMSAIESVNYGIVDQVENGYLFTKLN